MSDGSNSNRSLKASSGFKGGFFGCLGIVAAIFFLLFIVMFIARCSTDSAKSPASTAGSAKTDGDHPTASPGAAADNWTYTSTKDAMTDAVQKTACTTSTNKITQTFPYENTDAQLCIRKGAKSTDVYVSLNSKGQILCGFSGCSIPVRFGSGKVQNMAATEPADNSSDMIFIDSTPKFLSGVKGADKTLVELNLYQNGSQSLTFNTKGLKWP